MIHAKQRQKVDVDIADAVGFYDNEWLRVEFDASNKDNWGKREGSMQPDILELRVLRDGTQLLLRRIQLKPRYRSMDSVDKAADGLPLGICSTGRIELWCRRLKRR